MKRIILFSLIFFLIFEIHCTKKSPDISKQTVGRQSDGTVVIPTHQTLDPAGVQITFPGRPTDLAVSPDGKMLAVKNRRSLIFVNLINQTIHQELFIAGKGGQSYTGIVFSPDGQKVYTSTSPGQIQVAKFGDNRQAVRDSISTIPTLYQTGHSFGQSWQVALWDTPINIPALDGSTNSVPGGMIFLPDGKTLLVAVSRNNTLAVVDVETHKVKKEIPVGVAPFTVVIARGKAYVSNWGGRIPAPGEPTALSSGTPVLIEPKNGIANNGTVSVIDLSTFKVVKTISVGLHPSGIAVNSKGTHVFVANANSDVISVISTGIDKIGETFSTAPNPQLPFGSAPNALTVSNDGKTLYVANGTNNAIAVVSLGVMAGNFEGEAKSRVTGFIPTGWYPGAVKLIFSEDQVTAEKYRDYQTIVHDVNKIIRKNQLVVANIKGLGSLNMPLDRKGRNSHDHLGSVSLISIPNEQDLRNYTKRFYQLNHLEETLARAKVKSSVRKRVPVPNVHGEPSVFKHVLYIIKENRTYDQVLGDLPQGNGDTSLVLFGRNVTPNHHALAEEFVLLDNFYCSGVLSADGHQWTDEAYVTDYLERFFGNFARSYPYEGDDPLAFASSGFIWDNVLSHGLTFRNYGEFVKAHISPSDGKFLDIYQDFKNGMKKYSIRASTDVKNLEPYLCPTFIGFPGIVPDVYRANEFIKELKQFEISGNFPNFMIMLLPNDHTIGTQPDAPTPQASVADNDLALGQIVDAVSHSKFWKETAIFVVEDDPQAGFDHVDGHRTVAFVISPYTKRNAVISINYNQISMVKTIELILGIPPMNQFDLAATPMTDCFQERLNLTPYTYRPNNIPLDQINPPLSKLQGSARYWAEKSLSLDLEEIDKADEDTFNRILWHSVKGDNIPYPLAKK